MSGEDEMEKKITGMDADIATIILTDAKNKVLLTWYSMMLPLCFGLLGCHQFFSLSPFPLSVYLQFICLPGVHIARR